MVVYYILYACGDPHILIITLKKKNLLLYIYLY